MSEPSWMLKMRRADKHLVDLKQLLRPATDRKLHPVRETLEPEHEDGPHVYRLDLSQQQPPDTAPILAGDFLFNVRSALDHLAVAIAPAHRKELAAFPILTEDPFAKDGSDAYVHGKARRVWRRCTQDMPPAAIAALARLQPYEAARKYHSPADYHALAILADLQNADKHRELLVAYTGLGKTALTVDGETHYVVPILKDGTAVWAAPLHVNVQMVGAAHIAFGLGGHGAREFPRTFDAILEICVREVMPALERYVRD